MKPIDFFINYRTEDIGQLAHFINYCLKRDFNTFFDDKNIEEGDDLSDKIKEGIDNCGIFLIVIGKKAASLFKERKEEKQIDFVSQEISYAKEKNKKIIVIVYEKAPLQSEYYPDTLSEIIYRKKYFKLEYEGLDMNIERMVRKLRNLLNGKTERRKFLGIDLGSTKIAAGVVEFERNLKSEEVYYIDNNTNFVKEKFDNTYKEKHSTKSQKEYITEELFDNIIKKVLTKEFDIKNIDNHEIASILRDKEIEAIGIGLPGQVDVSQGLLHYAPGLGLYDIKFKEKLERRFKIDVYIDNDVNCATLAEMLESSIDREKANQLNNFVCIYYGTGIGAGIVINRKIIRGYKSAAGEIGHIKINSSIDARQCNCGLYGCYEEYASTRSIERQVKTIYLEKLKPQLINNNISGIDYSIIFDKIQSITPTEISSYLSDGRQHKKPSKNKDKETKEELMERLIKEICNEAAEKVAVDVAIGLANIATLLNPEKIIVGGGLIEGFFNKSTFKEKLKEQFDKLVFDKSPDDKSYFTSLIKKTKFEQSERYINSGPIIGAAYLPIDLGETPANK